SSYPSGSDHPSSTAGDRSDRRWPRGPPRALRPKPARPAGFSPHRGYSRDTGLVERYDRVRLTNPDKVLYPATGTTKAEIFEYYVAIADVMMPHIAGRAVTRKRWPNGVDQPSFFEKQLASSAPDWLHRGTITHKSGTTTYPIIDTR